jgi:hypothetical protein
VPDSNRRLYYRVPYPASERPRLVIGTGICEVLDCSERGIRYRPSPLAALAAGAQVEGRLRFPRGEELPVRGSVVRADDTGAALQLQGAGIPFAAIIQEQLYLRRAQRRQRHEALSSRA